jgi:putative transposase
MTDDRMALAELLKKGSDSDLLRELIGYVAQRPMDLDVAGLVAADHWERAESRENWFRHLVTPAPLG